MSVCNMKSTSAQVNAKDELHSQHALSVYLEVLALRLLHLLADESWLPRSFQLTWQLGSLTPGHHVHERHVHQL